MLPSPIPHPLDYCPWDVPGWIYEALDWVVGVEWPEGNERAVWDLADQWYGVADVLAGPRNDATTAAGEVRSGYGGVGLVAQAFDVAWGKVAEGEDAPLHVLVAATGELGRLVDSCGCDIEGAKLEAWIELGILVVELLSLAVATVLTMGAASPAAGAAITASRVAVQQIFKRLVAQLARKAVKEGLKEAGERAAKEVVKSGARGLARRAVLAGLVEAGQEAGTSLATQAYQNSTGRRDGLDLTDVGMSGLGGFAGGAAAPLAGLGRHSHGRFAQIGERFGREMAGETLAESAAGLATGQDLSLEDLARAAASGASGSATGQVDSALHHRLDEKLAGLPMQPVDLGLPPSGDAAGLIPSQHLPDPAPLLGGPGLGPVLQPGSAVPSSASNAPSSLIGDGAAPAHLPSVEVGQDAAGAGATPPHRMDAEVKTSPPSAEATTSLALEAASPTLSSVTVDAPVAGSSVTEPRPAPVNGPTAVDIGAPNQATPVQAAATVASPPATATPQPNGPVPMPPDRSAFGAVSPPGPAAGPPAHSHVAQVADPVTAPSATGPDARPAPSPRFPLLEALAPQRPAADPPTFPGPFEPLPPRRSSQDDQAARLAAGRETLERLRYERSLQEQRQWYEEGRRQQEAEWLRVRADQFHRAAGEYGERASQLHRAGHQLLARRWQQAAHEASTEAYDLREMADQVLAGSVAPTEVMVEDDLDFYRINDDVADLALGAVETPDHSALTGHGHPPPIDRSRRYGVRGGLRPPLALHQTDLERQMPRNPDGNVVRTADPRQGGWFRLANDGGPAADATRGINCLDCTLSLFETWMHGRPRVSAPRTFDGYLLGDVLQPVGGEVDGPRRVEEITGGRFQSLCPTALPGVPDPETREMIEDGYRDLQAQLLAGGHGSYAFLITSMEGGGSHAWVALNQNGTVLYLDPQMGRVGKHPLYSHNGIQAPHNVVAVDALVLGPDGRPMPLAGRPPGDYNVLPEPIDRPAPPRPPEPPPPPDDGDAPDFNQVHLLGESTTFHRPDGTSFPGRAPDAESEAVQVRNAHRDAHADRIAAGLYVRDALAASGSLDEVFAAGVTPVELAQHLDGPTLQRLVPELDRAAADDLTRLLADPRVRQMLDQTWEAPPRREELLAETLVRQLAQRPDLVRMILSTPELANSLIARPVTLHHLASHQKAIDVLGEVLDEIAERGSAVVAASQLPPVAPTPLTSKQMEVSAAFAIQGPDAVQPGFDLDRLGDAAYRQQYLDQLYASAVVAQAEIDALGRRLAEASGSDGKYYPRPKPKDRGRAEDKIDGYGGDVSQLTDLAAGRVSFERLDDLYEALASLRGDERLRLAEFEDRFVTPQKGGYRDVQMLVRTSMGHLAEFRLHLAALDDVATWEHSLYEVRRDLGSVAREQGRSLSDMESAIRKGIIHRQREYFWAALKSALTGGHE
ncbi:toxin glutamine deamidase domain-containing protein [Micromonospora fulviviridis]|uniref:toxin glutamine deamidase domain-containing protein n=1 Tax=Micromonospora fulviviridis TaxID=47860 RepID=UPI001E355877|nr:toxin glutamine deamidase domain-containing protein [Micromonospora fulviviridis]